MNDVRQYKQLQSQLNTMIADAFSLKIEAANKQREYQQKIEAIKKMRIKMASLDNDRSLKVSEHALLRYFERVKGFDLEQAQKEILTETVIKMVEQLGGNGSYPNENFSVVVKNFTVTTII